MSLAALVLVLIAAFAHAGWNLFSKQAAQTGGVAFTWAMSTLAVVLYLPVMITAAVLTQPRFGPLELGFCVGTALVHLIYFLLLQRAYRHGDLSFVYPLARGTGPLLASLIAVVVLGERPGISGFIGIGLVTLGVLGLSLPPRTSARPPLAAVLYGFATGVSICVYTLWDSYAVTAIALSPIILDWASDVGRAVILAPVALRHRVELRKIWENYRVQLFGAALLSPLAYILVLFAMRFTPVSSIAPAREVSVLIGVALGGRLLAEGQLRRRLVAAAAVAGGVIAIALG